LLPVKFTKEALFDIEEIVLWYEEQREGLSYEFELCLEAGVGEIKRDPNAFQKRYRHVKILFISRFPFGIHYVVNPDNIIVIGILHTSRSPKNWSKRI
jgi:plasmid stabilization system protein ParE